MVSSASSPPTKIHASRTSSICSVGGDCGAKVCKLLAGSEHHVVDNAVVRVGLYRGLSGLGGRHCQTPRRHLARQCLSRGEKCVRACPRPVATGPPPPPPATPVPTDTKPLSDIGTHREHCDLESHELHRFTGGECAVRLTADSEACPLAVRGEPGDAFICCRMAFVP